MSDPAAVATDGAGTSGAQANDPVPEVTDDLRALVGKRIAEQDADSALEKASLQAHSGSSIGDAGDPAVGIPDDSQVPNQGDGNVIGLPVATGNTQPSDEQILSFENALRHEQSQKRPLLGDLESISQLQAEYQEGSPIFIAKVAHLCSTYSTIRKTRQDGNCFYRCFIYGLLEALLAQNDQKTTTAVIEAAKGLETLLSSAGITKLVYEDAMEVLLELLQAVSSGPDRVTPAELLLRLNSEDMCNMLVMLVRFVASAHICVREEHFLPFILGTMDSCASVDDFRRRCVEVMGEESDHIQVVAVSEAFQVPIEVVYLDNSVGTDLGGGRMACNTHRLDPPTPLANASVPTVTVLYRPGHYDLLYA